MPTPNIPALQSVMQYIVDHPENHDQRVWMGKNSCGTAACFAGWTGLLLAKEHGYRDLQGDGWIYIKDGKLHGVREMAMDILGLNEEQASMFFASYNTLPILELMVKDLANGDQLGSWNKYVREGGPLGHVSQQPDSEAIA